MGNIKNFYDLKVWQDGHKLAIEVYKVTGTFPTQDLGYLDKENARDLFRQGNIILKELNGLINSANKQIKKS